MKKQDGQVGQSVAVLDSMRAVVANQRETGQVTVPIQWVENWISRLEAELPAYGYGAFPLYPFSRFDFHPVDTFLPFFPIVSERVRFTTTTLK